MLPDRAFNEFVLKFANVNGSGSASANLLCAKALFRMGLPVSPKNIFPSNIQGLPTWYEIRVSEAGHLARRAGIDIMVAMNPQTYAADTAEVVPGGSIIYDSTWPRNFGRDDINQIGIPIAALCAEEWSDPRQRQLFKNVVYLGALSWLIEIDIEIIERLLAEQFRAKPKLVEPNLKALQIGRDYVHDKVKIRLPVRARKSNGTADKIMISGNEAAGLGAVYAGATVASWYPITPSTSLAEAFERYASKLRRDPDGKMKAAVIQAEDELSAAGMAIGANWNGARAFTATSGPGISLMSEFIGLAYFAEIPLVLFDIQRGGPSTGMPTRTQQSDILACAYASHGDTRHVLVIPGDPGECFSLTADAFDLADRLQTPVFVMSDLDIGMNDWVVDSLQWDDTRRMDRGKVLDAAGLEAATSFGRYRDVDGDGIPWRTIPGTHPDKGAYFTRGTSHTDTGGYTEDGTIHAAMLERIASKFETAKALVPKPVVRTLSSKSRLGIINFGSTDPAIREAMGLMAREGYGLNHMRLRAFPFSDEVMDFIDRHDFLFVVEQNRDAQMRHLLIAEAEVPAKKLVSITNCDGMPLTAAFVMERVLAVLRENRRIAEASAPPITAA
ncbi:2-oxoacid:acceptor oxidoreductase subunit alpha [Microbaculum marinum]|uniref:2-oxoacid:acceptor oxidoreductase subunit alpha n=1 Tax=Microbaculum marinum TaxID=1764581 RepID=A0AAW9RT78_9HYPH